MQSLAEMRYDAEPRNEIWICNISRSIWYKLGEQECQTGNLAKPAMPNFCGARVAFAPLPPPGAKIAFLHSSSRS